MTAQEIHNSNEHYKQYPNFLKYYKDLKECVEAEIEQVKSDDIAAEQHLRNNPRKYNNKRGYPHWDKHAAKKLLETDVTNKLYERITPWQLQRRCDTYKEFPPEVFAKRLYAETDKQKAATFWAFKRNKKGLARYLENITL